MDEWRRLSQLREAVSWDERRLVKRLHSSEFEERQVAGTITLSVRQGSGRASRIPNPNYLTVDRGEE